MNVVIFGASGGVGRCLVEQALAQDHYVTAAVRNPGAALLFLVKRFIRHTLVDHRRALEEIRGHVQEWIVVRPLALSDGPLTGRYRIAIDGLPAKGMHIARADVADFMLRQATSDDYLYKVPAIAY